MQNCEKPWSVRRQRQRCSASSVARRPTCSRSSTPSSKALREFVELMTCCCDSTREAVRFQGLILALCPLVVARSVLMNHGFAGCGSTARSTCQTSASETNSNLDALAAGVPSCLFPFVSRANSLDRWARVASRDALHPGADQAPRDLRRPGRDRHRECATVPRAEGI